MEKRVSLLVSVWGLALMLVLALLWAAAGESPPAIAAPPVESQSAPSAQDEWHVCPTLLPTCDYTSIQKAVDAASTNETIKVAGGIYGDIHYRDSITQVVYISKTLNLLGGYTPLDWNTPRPEVNLTILDAQGQGRVIVVMAEASVWLQGLYVTGGDATGLGGGPSIYDYDGTGGGIYVDTATVSLDYCTIYGNIASTAGWGRGGGVYLYNSPSALYGNMIYNNTASSGIYEGFAGEGGGIAMAASDAVLFGNLIWNNVAASVGEGTGGGIYMEGFGSFLVNNIAASVGEGIGGEIYMEGAGPLLVNNVVRDNTASATERGDGGGIYIGPYANAMLTNSVVVGNVCGATGDSQGAGIYVAMASPRLSHSTIHDNTGGDGSGVTLLGLQESDVFMTNTILVSQTVGISVEQGSFASLNGVLWYGNGANTGGGMFIDVTNDITGTPAFAPDGYHLRFDSAALNAGVDAGVTFDIDGESRPFDLIPDLGADELPMIVDVIDPSTGITITFTDTQGLTTTVEVPPGAVIQTTTLTLAPLLTPAHPLPPGECFAGHALNLDAFCPLGARVYLPLIVRGYRPNLNRTDTGAGVWSNARGNRGEGPVLYGLPAATLPVPPSDWFHCTPTFQKPVTITIRYSEADIACISNEDSLLLYYWTGSLWEDAANTCVPPSSYGSDPVQNVLQLPICHLSQFAIGGN